MRKILMISFASEQKFTGGLQCTKRNYESLKAIFGDENIYQYVIQPYKGIHTFPTKIKRVIDIFLGYMGGLNRKKEREIDDIICQKNITDVFIDSSLLGLAAKHIRRNHPQIRITVFFHNFERGFVKDYIYVNKDYFRIYWAILTGKNERSAIRYADTTICLNERDKNQIERCYGRKIDYQIPITIKDNYTTPDNVCIKSTNKEALFLGSYFFGNVQGIKWFCRNVLPFVDINLTIIGSSMERLANEMEITQKINIFSDVPDLKPYFEQADFVILPILSGSGMKVKTAESLMYGKYILGTDEAFRGYEITEETGLRCNSAETFINAINNLNLANKFNMASRNLYKEKYSFESSIDTFRKALDA